MSASLPDAQRSLFRKMARLTVQITNPKNGDIGAGVVITKEGLILTAYHVVAGCKRVRVKRCRLADDRWVILTQGRYTADVILEDKNADIAVLLMRNPPKRLRAAKIGKSEIIHVGEPLYRLGMDEYRMASGHVIYLRKTTERDGHRYKIPGFEVSMPSAAGASGGPVFDTVFELVGITQSVSISQAWPTVSYCIPVHAVLRRIGRRAAVRPHLAAVK